MTLATTCPHCRTSFRVTPEQLKLRDGLVRCGHCRQVFSGIEGLQDPTAWSALARPPLSAAPHALMPEAPVDAGFDYRLPPDPLDEPGHRPVPAEAATRPTSQPEHGSPELGSLRAEVDSLESLLSHEALAAPSTPSEAPPRIAAADDDDTLPGAIDFFTPRRSTGGFASRSSLILAALSLLLGLLLSLQLLLWGRERIVALVPETAPAVEAVAGLFGLSVEAPRRLDSLTLESFDLQSAGEPGHFTMNALLRNRAPHPVRWPAIELTLADGSGTVVLRKVLRAETYLPLVSESPGAALGAGAEASIRLLLLADGVDPITYRANLFYP